MQTNALLNIYRSSAGSGKTFTLVKEYLKIALTKPESFHRILAITFTVKATEEIKIRILRELDEIKKNEGGQMRKKILEELQSPGGIAIDEKTLLKNAVLLQRLILHRYPYFAVSTIDSFFQKIIRAFALETNLPLQIQLETDVTFALENGLNNLIRRVGAPEDKELTAWLSKYIKYKINKDGNWDIRKSLLELGNELFKESYQQLAPLEAFAQKGKESRTDFLTLKEKLDLGRKRFAQEITRHAQDALTLIEKAGLSIKNYKQRPDSANLFQKALSEKLLNAEAEKHLKNIARIKELLANPAEWLKTAKSKKEQADLEAARALLPRLQSYLQDILNCYTLAKEYEEVEKNFYALGILMDLNAEIKSWLESNNMLLISQVHAKVQHILEGCHTPFLYEKIGNQFSHYFLDEFQDTSAFQWKNLLPLVENGISEGYQSLIVGDIKQAIYRWRGGRYQLLAAEVEQDLAQYEEAIARWRLDTNYRSLPNIIQFNNAVFSTLPAFAAAYADLKEREAEFLSAFEAAAQNIAPQHREGNRGYVQFMFWKTEENSETAPELPEATPEQEPEDEAEENEQSFSIAGLKQKHKALLLVAPKIQELKTAGRPYSDMVILVRSNQEASVCAEFLLKNDIPVVTPESLRLKNSPYVRFLVLLIRWIANCISPVQLGELYQLFMQYIRREAPEEEIGIRLLSLQKSDLLRLLPPDFRQKMTFLRRIALIELVQELIFIFNMPADAFIVYFQDKALAFQQQKGSNLEAFLVWWAEKGENESIIMPAGKEAVRIMTIHQSKGLEFPIVFMPFLDWDLNPKTNALHWYDVQNLPEYQPFTYLPLNNKKLLEITRFAEQYRQECFLELLDNLNLLYVAFTRPVEKLYLYAQLPPPNKKKGEEKKLTVAALLYAFFSNKTEEPKDKNFIPLASHWDSAQNLFCFGEEKETPQEEPQKENLASLKPFAAERWRSVITIRPNIGPLPELLRPEYKEKINWGKVLHEVLAKMKSPSELNALIEEQIAKGNIKKTQGPELRQEIENLFAIEEFRQWFHTDWQIWTERDILVNSDSIYRPDRTLTKDGQATVIDYKTGKFAAGHVTQIKKYAQALEAMGYAVKAYLVYTALPAPNIMEIRWEETKRPPQ
jgi:ATP-dependent exoDNAse (exonuclease V) beta subunit